MNLDFDLLRKKMIAEQMESRGITDAKVLEAFANIPREKFVPEQMRNVAYEDHPLSIGFNQTISQPYMVALMTQVLAPCPGEKILEVGTGSGYQAAVLAYLGARVYSLERLPDLARRARQVLKDLEFEVEVLITDGTLGWEEKAPFSGIIITAASYKVPQPLLDQLDKGGRIVVPLGGELSQTLTRIEKGQDGASREEKVCGCVFVPLIGEHGFKQ